MTSKTFLIKKGIVNFQLKRFWWLAGFYALLLFLVTPFRILNINKEGLMEQIARFPHGATSTLLNDAGMFVLLIGAAVLIGLAMFRYMQNVRSATLIHAMPAKRKELYVSSLFAGVVLLALPILLNGLILLFVGIWGGYAPVLKPVYILDWVGGQLLTGTAVFCLTFFMGVLTGSTIAQLVFTFVFCFLPVGLMSMFSFLLEEWLFGFTNSGINQQMEFLLQIMPMYYPQFLCREPVWWIPVLAGIYILLFSGLGLFLYHKRDTERAGDVAAFNFMRPLFLYGVSICVTVVGLAFLRAVSGNQLAPSLIAMLLFALLGYVVAKALLIKSVRIFPYYKGYVVLSVVLLVLYSAVHFNFFGFGTHVPDPENLTGAYVGFHYTHNWQEDDDGTNGGIQCADFHDEESIKAICSLQQSAIEAGRISREDAIAQGKQEVYFSYLTESGRIITRVYYMKPSALFDLFSTPAAKDSMYENIRLYPERIKYVEVVQNENQEIYGEKKEELLACIRKDLDRLSYAEINKHNSVLRHAAGYSYGYNGTLLTEEQITAEEEGFTRSLAFVIDYLKSDRHIWFDYNENFTETVAWLTENEYIE